MYKINNEKIGEYLSKTIKKHYTSDRKFCRAYIEYNGNEATDEEIRKMANRLCQIIKGSKSIQIYDLPVFTKLLDVTCEEILSAGKYVVPKADRETNYSIAFSKNKSDWIKYIKREDKLILNPDEYGKTVIDYAIEFKNYDFLKFLIDNKYIWFDSRKDNQYCRTFGAGTSIQRRDPYRIDDFLQYKISTEDQLRMDIISLAIDNNDIAILDELRARELPELYSKFHYLSCTHPDFACRYNGDFVQHIAKTKNNNIFDYFTDEFEVRDFVKYKDNSKRTHIFMFPFISELLGFAIDANHPFIESALEKAINHNIKTYETLHQLIDEYIDATIARFNFNNIDDLKDIINDIKRERINNTLQEFNYYENGNIISFRNPMYSKGIITNIVHSEKGSKSPKIQSLIEKMNETFNRIKNIKNEYINN